MRSYERTAELFRDLLGQPLAVGTLANWQQQFQGTAVHDFWKPYLRFACAHAFCNVHLLRELKFVEEQHRQAWAKEMSAFLLFAKARVARNTCRLSSSTLQELQRQYHRILAKGFRANPPPPGEPPRRGRKKQSKSRNLLERLRTHAREILAFVHDFKIPFDNNQAERDLRMMKVQQKISGTFRSNDGARAFCCIRGFISTCRKQNLHVLNAIESVLLDKPVVGLT